jgi:hypothetical protein
VSYFMLNSLLAEDACFCMQSAQLGSTVNGQVCEYILQK